MNLAQFIRTILRLKTRVLTILGITFIVSILSFLIYNKNQMGNNPVVLSYYFSSTKISNPDEFLNRGEINQLGDRSDEQRLFTFMRSNRLKNHLIEKFDLISRYNIDINSTDNYSKLYELLDRKFTMQNEDVLKKLYVKDADNEFAIELGKEIILKASEYSNELLIDGKKKQLTVCEKQIKYFQDQRKSIGDSILIIKDKIVKRGFRFRNLLEFKSDVNTLDFVYRQYQQSKNNPKVSVDIIEYYKNELNSYKAKYGLSSYNDFNRVNIIREEIAILDELSDDVKNIDGSIKNYKKIRENIKFSMELISLDQPTINSVNVPHAKSIQKPYILFISILIAIYITLLYLIGHIQYQRFSKYIRVIQNSNS